MILRFDGDNGDGIRAEGYQTANQSIQSEARLAITMEEQREMQEKIRDLEKKKRRQRQQIFDLEDEITQKRDDLISALERRMTQKTTLEPLFTIAWKVA